MTKVSSIMKQKGADVVTVPPAADILAVTRLLRERGIGAVVVSADGREALGIYSERDLVRDVAEHGPGVLSTPVSVLMTKALVTCTGADDVKDIMRTMTQRRIRHIPVLEGGRLAGIISIGDVVKSRLDDMEMEANVLRDVAVAVR
jgi:CBS domain-containing protein